MRATSAAELVETDAEKAALAVLVKEAGPGGPLERHGVRLFLFCEAQARERGVKIDREVVLVAALLHDVGLYDGESEGGVYVTDGAEFTRGLLEPFGWAGQRVQLCFDAIERHHELRSQWERGDEVEFMRRADLIDLSNGAFTFGLPRKEVRETMRAVPRKGLYTGIGRLLAHVARERPTTLPRIFRRG